MERMFIAFCYIVVIALTIIATAMIIGALKLGKIYAQIEYQNTLLEQIESNTFKSYMKDRIDLRTNSGMDLETICRKYDESMKKKLFEDEN